MTKQDVEIVVNVLVSQNRVLWCTKFLKECSKGTLGLRDSKDVSDSAKYKLKTHNKLFKINDYPILDDKFVRGLKWVEIDLSHYNL